MNNNTLLKVKTKFAEQLLEEGDVWRIFRKSTLVDLIKLNFYDFQLSSKEIDLINLFNNSMRLKLLSKIKSIEVNPKLDETISEFNQQPEFILLQYDSILKELEPTFLSYSETNVYDLNNKIQYIKVVNALDIDSYADDIFDEIIAITYNILLSS